MRHSFLDRYSDRDSLIHRLDARTKLVTTLLFLVALLLTPPGRWEAYLLYSGLLAVLILLSQVPPLYILRRSMTVIPFVLVMAALLPFWGREGQAPVNMQGVQVMVNILVKSWLSILSLILLTSTTRLNHLLKGMEQLKVPRVMVMLLSFMYRYIFVLVDEVMRLKQARDSRNFGGKWRWQLRTVGNIIGVLFIRSYERGERVYAAMVSRGFDGEMRSLKPPKLGRQDVRFGVITGLLLALVTLFSLF